ncbi:hypothetical protein HPB47_023821 [Ixodes persulcatus]|uniref:Uncharacterized protein n=1 Tax=Ixodes persulcatus TaxID=34615 RepID=A0AC60Q5Z3_IXOPE|nr:hypothetical protein HPB47_023821 [Ixodes persulcatus]
MAHRLAIAYQARNGWSAGLMTDAPDMSSADLRLVSVDVPSDALLGGSAKLRCRFELGDAPLYSVKWYKGNHEIFRYVPNEQPPEKVFPLRGVTAAEVVARLSAGDADDYDKVKSSLLKRYRLSAEAFRQRFRNASKKSSEGYSEFAYGLKTNLIEWLKSEEVYESRDKRLLKAYSKSTSSGQRLYHRPFEVSLAPEGLLKMEPSATFFRVSTLRKLVTISSGLSSTCRSLPKTSLNASVTSTGPLPKEGPRIKGAQTHYDIGDTVGVNCSAPASKPGVNLWWFLNKLPAQPPQFDIHNLATMHDDGLESSASRFRFVISEDHFVKGTASIKCVAEIPGMYMRAYATIIRRRSDGVGTRAPIEATDDDCLKKLISGWTDSMLQLGSAVETTEAIRKQEADSNGGPLKLLEATILEQRPKATFKPG